MRDLRRKLLSLGNHFFERLKTANFSTACGTSTLKSLPSRAFFVSDVHLRPRKHFSRCTLDCGFKTSESPALRGFVGGPRALATAVLYLVLLSNGFPYSKIRLKKFDFSPIDTPANIAKKLPSQRCSQPFLIAFSTSRTNGPCSLLQAKAGTHSAFRERSHTRAHAPKQGAFPPSATMLSCAVSEIPFSPPCFYIHTFPGSMWTTTISNSSISDHLSSRFSASRTNGPRSLSRVKAGTHSAFGEKSHTRAHTAKQVVFWVGGGITTLGAFHTFRKPCVARG